MHFSILSDISTSPNLDVILRDHRNVEDDGYKDSEGDKDGRNHQRMGQLRKYHYHVFVGIFAGLFHRPHLY